MAAKKTASKSAKRVTRIAPKKEKKFKMDPAVALILKILCGCALLIYMFLSVYTDVAGVIGSAIAAGFLISMFGG